MKYSVLGSLLFSLVVMQGCSSMSQQECQITDWHAVGFEDGARGLNSEHIGEYRKACTKHGVVPDLQAYRAGREEGLLEFCKPQRGYDLGARGGNYAGTCPQHLENDFASAYRDGRQLYERRSAVNSVSKQISQRTNELAGLSDRLIEIETALVGKEATAEERRQMLVEIHAISERRGQLEFEIDELADELAIREQELRDYERSL